MRKKEGEKEAEKERQFKQRKEGRNEGKKEPTKERKKARTKLLHFRVCQTSGVLRAPKAPGFPELQLLFQHTT